MGRDADIVVVGAGITGVATARALAQSGRGVILVEQFGLRHDRGSSHGASRIFRLSYPDPHNVRLAQGALQAWRELEAECGEELIVHTGGLDFGAVATENARALAACGVRHTLLTGAEVTERWPIAAEPEEQVLFQPDGGTTLADRAYEALLAAAVDAGAVVLDHRRVLALVTDSGSVRVQTDGDEIVAQACVVAAGAWARALLADAAIELPVVPTRETVAYFSLPDPLALPPVIDAAVPNAEEHGLLRPGLINYALAAPGVGLKAGLHHAGPPADPDEPGIGGSGDRAVGGKLGVEALPGPRPGAGRDRDMPLYEYGRRVIRARATRPDRRRVRLLGSWLQVRTGIRAHDRVARPRSRSSLTFHVAGNPQRQSEPAPMPPREAAATVLARQPTEVVH